MTSFGKLEDRAILDVLERVCGNRIDRPVGSVVYTQLLDERGRIVGDVTVTRLAEDRFRVVTGAGAVDCDRGFLELQRRDAVDDVTDELAVIGIWGPDARAALARGRRSRSARRSRSYVGGVRRCSRSGSRTSASSGTSSTSPRDEAVQVWDALFGDASPGAGRLPGARLAADREGLPLLRHRHDRLATRRSTAGVGFAVAKGKHPELDRDPPQRLRTLARRRRGRT